ncbi:16S rRNA (cytosine(1402)-N(4))-methyltransferase RsmH [Prosthecochloris vibrioformis]|uniref:Ribosomal RNA small subunit methyltransferase H n=1 Tax=Prosthecochloris vibrioformis TaxID=1098 RepID=A0A5C4S3G3_PROVB|nr:16S rRNA (cytosine(1402)-N(4))-methyltransferase RsmH [Prosthecochloris vibrioformis]TNJ37669.1 16S rRNA (cytosine(1402)-N(4))-methyltransferase RsmH [Prosthecochloris vibrioformis]
MEQASYHEPVMARESVELLVRMPGIYVDCTLGGGGHAEAFLNALHHGEFMHSSFVIGIDQDTDALAHAARRLERFGGSYRLVQGNFGDVDAIVREIRSTVAPDLPVAGVFADLGVSSFQIDTPDRGFSYLRPGPLDMRMDPGGDVTAASLVRSLDERELGDVFYRFGEERQSRRIAAAVKRAVASGAAMDTTIELASVVRSVVRGHEHQVKSLSRIFQALRIAVNEEMAVLEQFLEDAPALLAPCGRLGVMSYHSLEDRMVKQKFRSLSEDDWGPRGVGLREPLKAAGYRLVSSKPVVAAQAEVEVNPRARSAKLRVLENKESGGCHG